MTTTQDADHLRLLSIFHYVVAGIVGLFSLFPLIHVAIGVAMVTGAMDDFGEGQPPPAMVGWFFIVIPGAMIAMGLTLAVCIGLAGQRLATARGHLYCLIIAGLECLFVPFGTVLGVFTIIVLLRPSVKERFGVRPY